MKRNTKLKRLLKYFAISVCFMALSMQTNAQYVKASGTKILDPSGSEIHLHGINLGNWLLWEGYLMMGDFNYRTHTQFFNSVKEAFGNDLTKAMEFEHQWRLNYVTEQAIIDLKNLGFNSVRVPFHFNMFWDWNTYAPSNRGFQYIDQLIQYCSAHNVYIMLDMHAAPGYQNPGDHADNLDSDASQPRESVQFWDGDNINIASQVWKHIADYYKNEPIIWGYDLINEPVPQPGREYELLGSLITLRNAIREVDNNHVIVAEGSWWGSDMQKLDWMDSQVQANTGINYRWDNNLVYQTHHYSTDINALNGRLDICNKLNIPFMLGEYGESDNGNIRNMTDWCINNNVSYFPWSFKKMSHDRCLYTIPPNNDYNELKNFINNGTTPPADLYEKMISFCQNNIVNGAPDIVWHQGFYDAVKYNNSITGCDAANAINVPAIIQAENYCDMNGIQTETTGDVGGGENIGFVDAGDWCNYRINVPKSGDYKVYFRVAADGTATKSIELQAGANTASVNYIATGGWQTWSTVSANMYLNAGDQVVRLHFPTSGQNVNYIELEEVQEEPILTSINVSPTNVTLDVGQTQQFTATGYDQNSNVMPINPTWSGTNSNGLFTATSAGNYTVRASVGSISSSANVVVNEVLVLTTIAVTPTNVTLDVGQNQQFTATGYDQNGNIININPSWNGTNSNGLFTANSTGSFTVIATENNVSGSANVIVNDVYQGIVIPGIVQAEEFTDMYGIQTETTSDAGGGENIGWVNAGDWCEYTINVANAGNYEINVRVAADGTESKSINIEADNSNTTVNFNATGGWQTWITTSSVIYLNAGSQTLQLNFPVDGINVNWIELKEEEIVVLVLTTIELSPANVMLSLNETQQFTATGYDQNGNVMSINPSWTGTNSSGLFTASNVGNYTIGATQDGITGSTSVTVTDNSIEPIIIQAEDYFEAYGVQTENTSDTDGGLNVGWLDAGDWMAYSVNIPGSGNYTVEYRVASQNGGGNLNIENFGGNPVYNSISIPQTNGWQNWITISHTIYLNEGNQDLALAVTNGGFNINWFRISTSSQKAGKLNTANDLVNNHMKVYPNPAVNEITIETSGNNTPVTIYDITGSVVMQKSSYSNKQIFDISELNKGIYIIHSNNSTQRLIKK